MSDYLTRDEAELPERGLRINEACDRFEAAWRGGARPRLEEFLAGTPGSDQPELLRELVLLDVDYRFQAGENPTLRDYRERLPGTPLDWLALELDEAPLTKAGRYRIEQEIGRGGMGVVYKAHDPDCHRSLAVKVPHASHAGSRGAAQRFLEEARLTGQLQHPGIVPVHEIGRLPDGRPFFAMKLVQGRTLSELLTGRTHPGHRLPYFVDVFAKVCQAVAYAHAKGVIHRDLKPSNVMVGEFGEVHVMDWGLTKVFEGANGGAPRDDSRTDEIVSDRTEVSRTGSVLGTPAYMAPEQARGETGRLGPPSDVFGLGAILCVILTGQPPYRGRSSSPLTEARDAELGDAEARLGDCAADEELVRLARACLASDPRDRPADARAVAAAVADYKAGVQERLRRAEVERAAAEVRAREESKRRRLVAALALAVVVFLASAGGAGWWAWGRRQEAVQRAELCLRRASDLRRQAADLGGSEPSLRTLQEAVEEARKAENELGGGLLPADLDRKVQAEVAAVQRELADLKRDRQALADLESIRASKDDRFDPRAAGAVPPPPGRSVRPPGTPLKLEVQVQVSVGAMTPEQGVDADQEYAKVFAANGINVARLPGARSELAERLRAYPPAVRVGLTAILDDWALERARGRLAPDLSRELLALAAAADDDPWRNRLRASFDPSRGRHNFEAMLPAEAARLDGGPRLNLALLAAELGRAGQQTAFRRLAAETEVRELPVPSILLLAAALRRSGATADAESVLRRGRARHPSDVWLNHALGRLLHKAPAPDLPEAIGFYRVAQAVRREICYDLSFALQEHGRPDEALDLLEQLCALRPDNPHYHIHRAVGLLNLRRLDDAIAACGSAIDLDPASAQAHNNRGVARSRQGYLAGAIEDFEKATGLARDDALAPVNLGHALRAAGRPDAALEAFRTALDRDRTNAHAHVGLGAAHLDLGRTDDADTAFREAIALDGTNALAHAGLGAVLHAKQRWKDALAAFSESIRLDPQDPMSHFGRGSCRRALRTPADWERAVADFEKAVEIDPKFAAAYDSLGVLLRESAREGRFLSDGDLLSRAVAYHFKAIELQPGFAKAHNSLGKTLTEMGNLEGAVTSFRQAYALAPAVPEVGRNLNEYERQLALDKKLRAVLRGDARPQGAAEQVDLAILCHWPYNRLYASATRFFEAGFNGGDARGKSGEWRFHAARCAVLAAAGKGADAAGLSDEERAELRRTALRWLRTNVAARARQLERDGPKARNEVLAVFRYWAQQPDLKSVRDQAALDELSADERRDWEQLWAEVKALMR